MKRIKDSFSADFPTIVFTGTYFLSCFLLYMILFTFFPDIQVLYKAILTLALFVLSIFIWSYLYLLFVIPQKLAGSFDYIKNRISSGEISDSETFSNELANFLTEFYNYTFFDVKYSAVYSKGAVLAFSSNEIQAIHDWVKIESESAESPLLRENGMVKIGKRRLNSYSIPIYFCDKYLGDFTVFTKQKLGRIRRKFLIDLEENFIDDQLFRLIPEKDLNCREK